MVVEKQIYQKIEKKFSPCHLEVINESHQHRVPENSETHFKVVVVSQEFVGLGRVQRHQLIYKTLQDELQNGVHALSLQVLTPEEWGDVPSLVSPPCSHAKS